MHYFLQFIFGIKLYMFRTVPLSIMRSFSLYTQQWCMSYRFADSLRAGSERKCSSVLILLASCQQICMTYTIAVCTVKNSWWWTEELSETCSFIPKQISEISASSWFYYKNFSRCTITWTSHLSVVLTQLYEDARSTKHNIFILLLYMLEDSVYSSLIIIPFLPFSVTCRLLIYLPMPFSNRSRTFPRNVRFHSRRANSVVTDNLN